ncbi:UNVERIFIED_CONTAM: hypothetical protein GTU68_003226 [Idotea baltica]|nr:hypothetical protein [Idotea baltica]
MVRAKRKIKIAKIPYIVPEDEQLAERLNSVLAVIYLIFNEGYSAASGPALIRQDMCNEAIRLVDILGDLMPGESEVRGLLALMLLHNARQTARLQDGDLITLGEQDRSLWDLEAMSRGRELLIGTLASGKIGPYQLQAAISAVHSEAADLNSTDWRQIFLLYQELYKYQPSPIIVLNKAVALSYFDGPEAGLKLLGEISGSDSLASYMPFHAAKAAMLARAGSTAQARRAFETALAMGGNEGERDYLRKQLVELEPQD